MDKKIIAREGLVIITVLLIGLSCFGAAEVITKYYLLPWYRAELSNGKKYTLTLNKIEDLPTANIEEVKELVTGMIKEDNYPPNVTIKEIKIIRGRTEGFTGTKLQIEKIRRFGFYFLLFGYPVYLFFRFVIWAIKTLSKK